jgi:putative transposase
MRAESATSSASAGSWIHARSMARKLRPHVDDGIYHVTSRAARGGPLFVDHVDRLCFEDVLATSVPRAGFELLAYCLMGTHYHLLVRTPDANIGAGMKRLNWLYAWRFNRRHSAKGHAFESRYGSSLIADERHLLAAVRYIAQNPVRAELTSSPLGWRWSSYAPTIGVRPCPPFLMTAPVLDMFHHETWRARSALREFVEQRELFAAA